APADRAGHRQRGQCAGTAGGAAPSGWRYGMAVGGCDRHLTRLPRPLASRRSAAPSSLLAALVSPDGAAPLPLAPSVLPRPLASRRSDAPSDHSGPRATPGGPERSSLLAALVSPDGAAPLPLAPSVNWPRGGGRSG